METLDRPTAPYDPSGERRTRASLAGVLASVLLISALLYLGRVFFVTLISSILLAFLLEPLVEFFMRFRLPRAFASFVACTLMLGSLYLVLLAGWTQVVGLLEDVPVYAQRVTDLVDAATQQVDEVERSIRETLVPKRIREAQEAATRQAEDARKKARRRPASPTPPTASPALPSPGATPIPEVRIRENDQPLVQSLFLSLREYADGLLMASFVPFLVYFFLSWRDHMRVGIMNLTDGEKRLMIQRAWDGIAAVARAYLVGNFLLGLLLAVASMLFFWFVKLPYWQVIGPLSGFLSLVPYVGLPLAMLPPFVAALPVYDGLPAYLIIGTTVSLLHLIALNLLYPKLVGARVHLNPLVVTIALMVWYLLWGGAGLVLAIPITAGMKAVFDSMPSLRPYGRLLGED
jgi:predicted PurR-regulated permease PerM